MHQAGKEIFVKRVTSTLKTALELNAILLLLSKAVELPRSLVKHISRTDLAFLNRVRQHTLGNTENLALNCLLTFLIMI